MIELLLNVSPVLGALNVMYYLINPHNSDIRIIHSANLYLVPPECQHWGQRCSECQH